MRKSKATEWQKWKQLNAGVVISKAQLQEMIDAGVKENAMRWIETYKKARKRREEKR